MARSPGAPPSRQRCRGCTWWLACVRRVDCASALKKRWLPEEPVLYIGCTTQPIGKRVRQFYQQKYGSSGPHAGGEHLLMMRYTCPLYVYWAATGARKPRDVEEQMLSSLKAQSGGKRPFANGAD